MVSSKTIGRRTRAGSAGSVISRSTASCGPVSARSGSSAGVTARSGDRELLGPAQRLGARLGLAAVEPGGDDGDPHLVTERVVDDGTEDDVGVGVRGLLHQPGGLVDLEQTEVGPTGDRQQHAAGTVDATPRAAGWRPPSRRPPRHGRRRARSRCP